MAGRQGMNSTTVGARNRNRIVMELLNSPMHFSALRRKLKLSAVSLTGHLERLLEEGRIKRKVEGRKIVFVVVEEKRDQTVLEMREECLNELTLLMFDYLICLTKKTRGKLNEALGVLKESIDKREQDFDVAGRMMGYPESPLDKTRVSKLEMKTKRRSGK